MKRTIVSLFSAISCISAIAQDYTVSGTVQGLASGETLVLVPMSHDNEPPVAETTVNSDLSFQFDGSVDFPRAVYLRVKDCYGSMEFMLENANITISASVEKSIARDGVAMYSFRDTHVDGSPLSIRLQSYLDKREELDKLYEDTYAPFAELQRELGEARGAKDQAKSDSLAQTDEYKRMKDAERNFFQTVEKTYSEAIDENRDTYWGPLLALNFYSYFTPEQKPLYESFSEEAKQSWYGQKMKSEVYPGGGAGETARPFTVRDDDGTEQSLGQLSNGHKYLLIDFWASWCRPCRNEIPNVKAQYAKYKDKGLQVVSISIDRSEDAWRKALEEEQLEWPNFLDLTKVAEIYNVRAIPAMYLINAETKEIIAAGEEARGERLAEKLASLME